MFLAPEHPSSFAAPIVPLGGILRSVFGRRSRRARSGIGLVGSVGELCEILRRCRQWLCCILGRDHATTTTTISTTAFIRKRIQQSTKKEKATLGIRTEPTRQRTQNPPLHALLLGHAPLSTSPHHHQRIRSKRRTIGTLRPGRRLCHHVAHPHRRSVDGRGKCQEHRGDVGRTRRTGVRREEHRGVHITDFSQSEILHEFHRRIRQRRSSQPGIRQGVHRQSVLARERLRPRRQDPQISAGATPVPLSSVSRIRRGRIGSPSSRCHGVASAPQR
mmetsp:Transcript_13822/g.29442  ORF Transcript_13822/g.29442 Transcript_13822/m.29442 type:complete len:275 (+) Transcript_13822:266-1090(+)